MRAGTPFVGSTRRAFVDQLLADDTWAHGCPPEVRKAIASAIDRQCTPWFMDYEHWRDHVSSFCARSSRARARTVERFESHFSDMLREANAARAERAGLLSRVAMLEQQMATALLPPGERDSELLPTAVRIDRAQMRAARSRSPGPRTGSAEPSFALHGGLASNPLPMDPLPQPGLDGYSRSIGTPRPWPEASTAENQSMDTAQRVLGLLSQ